MRSNYGLGYALIQQGRQQEAKRFLCTSLSKVKNDNGPAGVSTLRDVKGLLKDQPTILRLILNTEHEGLKPGP